MVHWSIQAGKTRAVACTVGSHPSLVLARTREERRDLLSCSGRDRALRRFPKRFKMLCPFLFLPVVEVQLWGSTRFVFAHN